MATSIPEGERRSEPVSASTEAESCAFIPPVTNDLALEQELGRPEGDPVARAFNTLESARTVTIIPGQGLAASHAQSVVAGLAKKLEGEGKTVRFVLHPVAGTTPGHLQALLEDAGIDEASLVEMDRFDTDFSDSDAVMVIGANDVINPAAAAVPHTPLFGMPVLDVRSARRVIVCNLDKQPGFSGAENAIYDDPRAIFLFGDAKETVDAIVCHLP